MVLVAIGQKQDNSFLGDLLPNRDRRGVPFLDQNLRTELPNVWASGDYVVNPTNFISSIGEGKRVADLIDQRLRGTEPKVKEMEITRVPTEYIATPNPLVAEGIAEWSLTAMSRRLVWGDDYAGVGRQVMPSLPVAGSRHRHARHDARGRGRLHQADRVRGGQALPAVPAQYLHRRQPLHSLQRLRRCLPAPVHRDDLARPHLLDRQRRRAGRDGPRRAWPVRRGDGDRRAELHPLRHLRRLVPDRVPDDGSLPRSPRRKPAKASTWRSWPTETLRNDHATQENPRTSLRPGGFDSRSAST